MNKQVLVIVFLLGFYLGRVFPVPTDEVKGTVTTIVVLYVFILFIWAVLTGLKESYSDFLTRRHNKTLEQFDDEIRLLCEEISRRTSLQLSSEGVPQRFTTKDEALSFAKQWSFGDVDSYTAKAVDSNDCYEGHPKFDVSSTVGAILFVRPALFFGMQKIQTDDPKWWIEFRVAKKRWLKEYLFYLKTNYSEFNQP